jgi:hypothetical protein
MNDGLTSNSISSRESLKGYLENIRTKLLVDQTSNLYASPVYCLTAMNNIFNLPGIYQFLDDELKEIAREIWHHLAAAGFQIKRPSLLFQ